MHSEAQTEESATLHLTIRRILTMVALFSAETGLSVEELTILLALMMIAEADFLRNASPRSEAQAYLGVISQLTSIPKETVRRKLKKLAHTQLIEMKSESVYTINVENSAITQQIREMIQEISGSNQHSKFSNN